MIPDTDGRPTPQPEDAEEKYPPWRVSELVRKYANWEEDDAEFGFDEED